MPDPEVLSDKAATVLIGVVTGIWAANILAGMAKVNDYQPSESINGIFMAIVGGAFALRARAKSEADAAAGDGAAEEPAAEDPAAPDAGDPGP